ncbi:hypothetical protein [Planktotalea sp.]|uniref:hypothetical protein n=1 Tax=Planktotalea sp. TaxID=2029877 RepID=UPI003D6B004D
MAKNLIKSSFGKISALLAAIGSVIAIITFAQSFGYLLPREPSPVDGLKKAKIKDVQWAFGKWCGHIPYYNKDIVIFGEEQGRFVYKYFQAPIEFTDSTGQVRTLGNEWLDQSHAKLFIEGNQSFVAEIEDNWIESWGLTIAETLQVFRLNDDQTPTMEFTRCG